MGKKLNKQLAQLRARLVAGDATAMKAIQSLLYVPSYLQRMTPRLPLKNAKLFKMTHVAKRSGRAIPCIGTIGAVEEFPFRVARLKKIKERRHA